MLFFKPYCCMFAMTGVYDRFVGQNKKFGAYAVKQFIMVTAGQISAANAHPEQYIAANYKLLLLTIKNDTARWMARRKKYFKAILTQGYDVVFP